MYKFQSKQTTIMDFNMPLGMELDMSNRWVKKSQMIPWRSVEAKYAKLFEDSTTGNVAYPLRLALGALLIKSTLNYSDEELTFQIQENPYLQYFCGKSGYTNEPPFHPSSVTHFRKRLTPEILGEINEMIISHSVKIIEEKREKNGTNTQKPQSDKTPPSDTKSFNDKETKNDTNTQKPKSDKTPPSDTKSFNDKETLILDSTVAPQNIRYPLDLSLLDESRRKLEGMIDWLYKGTSGTKKPRTYRIKARKLYVNMAKKKKKSSHEVYKAIGKQLRFIERDIKHIMRYFKSGLGLPPNAGEIFYVICELYRQQKEMHDNRVHTIKNRIVSIRQHWVRPIVRGKAKAKVEFGAKIDVNVHRGFVRVGHTSFDSFNESQHFMDECKKFYAREGFYPKRALADQIYRNQENLKFCNEHGIEILGKPLGRPKKDNKVNKKQIRKSEIDRIEVERKIGLAKGSYSMALIKAKLKSTSLTTISIAIIAMNIAYAVRVLFVLLNLMLKLAIKKLFELYHGRMTFLKLQKMVVIQ